MPETQKCSTSRTDTRLVWYSKSATLFKNWPVTESISEIVGERD